MTSKFAVAGLPSGGGKAVVALPEGMELDADRRRDILRDVADAIASLSGAYATGPDVGTSPDDMAVIGETTPHVFCRPAHLGGSGDSSPHTAQGTLAALRAVSRRLYGTSSLGGRSLAVIGLGRVGAGLARLLAAEGAVLTVTDIDPDEQKISDGLGAVWRSPDEILAADVDIVVPAALGSVLTRQTAADLRCRAVVGPANNQLATPDVADLLHQRDIIWVPDYVASAGGVIDAVSTELHRVSADEARARVRAIEDTVDALLDTAQRHGQTPAQAASELARRRLSAAVRPTGSPTGSLRLRAAGPGDAENMALLHADSWRRHYRGAYSDAFLDGDVVADRRSVWSSRLSHASGSATVVAEDDTGLCRVRPRHLRRGRPLGQPRRQSARHPAPPKNGPRHRAAFPRRGGHRRAREGQRHVPVGARTEHGGPGVLPSPGRHLRRRSTGFAPRRRGVPARRLPRQAPLHLARRLAARVDQRTARHTDNPKEHAMNPDATTSVDHYDRLLAEHYTWMLGGDVHEVAARQAALLAELGLAGTDNDTAVDLGCGSGAQTLALIRLGFSPVIAVDTSRRLLDELISYVGDAEAVRPVHGDICTVLPEAAEPGTVAAVVCMGDTLPHLPSKADVPVLLGHVNRALVPGGHFVITYRDLTAELRGTDRFIPVRSSDDRLLTCFLEYRDEDTVIVHDLLHTRTNGAWQQQASSYPKLRLASSWLVEQCRAAGLDVRHDAADSRGMRILHAVKP
jgi:glutamate dehydrogenase/leucine dehydrogenase/SAM-dependent methyltransferase